MKIIFLDIDGVLCTYRTGVHQYDIYETNWLNWFCKVADIKIVISSSWRKITPKAWFDLVFGKNLHDDWKTGDDPDGWRGNEIQEWLDSHEVEDYLIIDDDTKDILESQRNNFLNTDFWQGFTFQNRIDVINHFKLDPDEYKIVRSKAPYLVPNVPNYIKWCKKNKLYGLSEY